MLKNLFFGISFLLAATSLKAQVYGTRNGVIHFVSKTPLENIEATNRQVNAVMDFNEKKIAFSLLMKGFLFERDLQQQHFNENYAESDKFPKSNFNGSIIGDVDVKKDGTYNVKVKGMLTIHGVSQLIETPATIQVKGNKVIGKCTFNVKPEDYKISIPSVVRDKIAKEVQIQVQIDANFIK